MLLTELLSPDRIKIPLVSTDKDALLGELVSVIGSGDGAYDLADVLRAVREREEVLSTGIGNGVAIPHGKSQGVPALLMVAGVAGRPVDFEALDGQPVSLFFLLVGPETAAGQHVKALSRVARLLRNDGFRRRLVESTSPGEFHRVLAEAEAS